jgi:sec-independent protein translocase protein TatC
MTPAEEEVPDSELEESRMTLGEHLDELRVRLIRSAVVLSVVFIAAWSFKGTVSEIALAPYEEKARPWLNERLFEIEVERLNQNGEPTLKEREAIFYDGIMEEAKLKDPIRNARSDDASGTFFWFLKVCGFATMFVGGPFVLWQIWAFIAAGLYRKERRVVFRYFPPSVLLFFGGTLFGYFVLVPYAYFYLVEMGLEQMRHDALISSYLKFLTSLGLGMGIVFQLPILMMALSRVGLIEPKLYGIYRGHFIVVALVVAAILTPPDPYTQLMMAGPMAVLYEVGIVLAKIATRGRRDDETGLEPS